MTEIFGLCVIFITIIKYTKSLLHLIQLQKKNQYLPETSLAGGNNSPPTQHSHVHDVEKASFISELAQL